MSSWNRLFDEVKNKEYSKSLKEFLDKEYSEHTCFPPRRLMFNAFEQTELDNLKVVVIGQDPYHEKGQAMGMSFSVPKGIEVPPSLVNIYKEIYNEYHVEFDMKNGDLTYLAKQGVLLLNALLSVREHLALSHDIPEYSAFLTDTLCFISSLEKPIVFMLWGNWAKKLKKYITNPKHLIIECAHPSPLSANRGGWFNQNQFIRANEYLKKNNIDEIIWYRL